ncbi:MAG: DUF3365 domain-containing protein [Gammaproteobacteria bacterium]|nr:DUF3365 domain-containing protein [Gammaproteobacteria bacterium]
MKSKTFIIQFLLLCTLIVYLFVTAPPPLSETESTGMQIPIERVFKIANEENKQARALYTKEIVQAGKKQGLKFDEQWQESNIIAGPLPAQFLRETAMHLEKSPVRLGLYLGSDYPINKVNQLSGQQLELFKKIKQTGRDHFYHIPEDKTYVYMSPDVAIAKACVSCHNEHKETPKQDWKLDDVMGATTWLYPEETISLSEALHLLSELRAGFRFAYKYFLMEIKQMKNPPEIGNKWPRDGYYVPSIDGFMTKLTSRSSADTLDLLMQSVKKSEKGGENDREPG